MAHVDRVAQIAHCQKLLHDLPIALQNSERAMKEHTEAEEVDLSALGAMLMEQKRIREEIADRQAKLQQLEKQVAESTINPPVQLYKYQTSITLPLGTSQLDGRWHFIQPISQIEGASAAGAASKPKAAAIALSQ